ncbi:hypothetical protein [Novosphingobium malaysiense]|uniref:hypothetical protein n=1 Tax=Novosphingobium malaysiense TaxID=1348853 RepID=UPI00068FB360|nr:hypothetical protein [Novosphingobium malaysiense]
MTRRLNYWLLALVIILGIPFYWYMIDPGPGTVQPKPVSMAQLRTLAGAIPGPRPEQIRVETVGRHFITRNRLVAGWGLRQTMAAVKSYELVFPDEKPIVIDAGTSAAIARKFDFVAYDPAAQRRVKAAMARARRVILLEETPLHNGGASRPDLVTAGIHSDAEPRPFAPGVVEIPAKGLGYDAKLVFVQLADGTEFLFAGSAAKIAQSLISENPPSRWATPDSVPNYREESKSWLTTINALHRQAPDMTIVTGQDPQNPDHAAQGFLDQSERG